MKVVYLLLGLILLSVVVAGCGGAEDSSEKIAVVESFISASNDRQLNQAIEYLASDVVFDTPTGRTEGHDAWLATVQAGNVPVREEPSNFEVDGNVVNFEMIVTFPDFQAPALGAAVVEDGKIQSYTVTEP